MRRLFGRLTGGPQSPNPKSSSDGVYAGNEKQSGSAASGDKVRALAAKFEAQSNNNDLTGDTTRIKKYRSSAPPVDASIIDDLPRHPLGPSEHADTTTASPVGRSGSHGPLSTPHGFQAPPPASEPPVEPLVRPRSGAGIKSESERSSREASGSSGQAASSLTSPANNSLGAAVKTVAFAPSPIKKARPSSPSAFTDEPLPVQASSSSAAGFARPTLASAARARSYSKPSSAAGINEFGVPNMSSSGLAAHSLPRDGAGDLFAGAKRTNYSLPIASATKNRRSQSSHGTGSANLSRRGSLGANPNGASADGATSGIPSSISAPYPSGLPVDAATAHEGVPRLVQTSSSTDDEQRANSILFIPPGQISREGGNAQPRSISPSSFVSAHSSAHASKPGGSVDTRRLSTSTAPGAHMTRSASQGNVTWSAASAATGSAPSWSQMTQRDLVDNLGPRERTRQEVLWEIVASEERYVNELEKAKDLYLDALLHPLRYRSNPTSPQMTTTSSWPNTSDSSASRSRHTLHPIDTSSSAELPIASRYMSPLSATNTRTGSEGHAQSSSSGKKVSSDAQSSGGATSGAQSRAPSIAAATTAAPPRPPRSSIARGLGIGAPRTSTRGASGAMSRDASATSSPHMGSVALNVKQPRKSSRKANSQAIQNPVSSQTGYTNLDGSALSVPLPKSLRAVLEALNDGLLEGHTLLSEALRVRYEEQWPLVRSLADVFTRYDYILKHYKGYVIHLERALEELEEAGLMERAMRGKRIKRERLTQTVGLGRAVASLETSAAERGECGLSIFISMPFQRLLKYPLLFQNLLYHTDPSTFEFENTVAMVVDVEGLVRSIESAKVSSEERDKAYDAFARIDGILDKAVLRPRPDRLLIEERPLYEEGPRRAVSESAPKDEVERNGGGGVSESEDEGPSASKVKGSGALAHSSGGTGGSNATSTGKSSSLREALKSKRSYRRLSDFLSADDKATKAPSMGSKRDVWVVKFSDVELKCQRVGVTALPMSSTTALRPSGSSIGAPAPIEDESGPQAFPSTEMDDSIDVTTGPELAADFAARSKDSKERLKALRNTTLRAKTRNLYKFVGVVAWRKAAQPSTSALQDELAQGIQEAEEDEDEEDEDEVGSQASEETEAGMLLDTERYVRQSTLSFSYAGDEVLPRAHLPNAHGLTPLRPSSSSVTNVYAAAPTHASSVAAFRFARAGAASEKFGQAAAGHNMVRNDSPKVRQNLHPTQQQGLLTEAEVVSRSHGVGRQNKFGARLRSELGSGSGASSNNAPLSVAGSRAGTSRSGVCNSNGNLPSATSSSHGHGSHGKSYEGAMGGGGGGGHGADARSVRSGGGRSTGSTRESQLMEEKAHLTRDPSSMSSDLRIVSKYMSD
ncbi:FACIOGENITAL DYSPLASIA PROTEIN [Ceraceosorus bombacis]|uniref:FACIOGENITAL DYSPLASIA PROTEIN n=1 Tax=Ceraceosorus bombacis TaxID=401625 RepID=A0A0P1BAR4_9BASI|nr:FACIOGENITAL DYSPLASIA PROTEIN [Ceraceosorus bombacis]